MLCSFPLRYILPLFLFVVLLSSCSSPEIQKEEASQVFPENELGYPDLISLHLQDKMSTNALPPINKISKEQSIRDRYKHEFDMTKDPKTGKIPKDVLFKSQLNAVKQAAELSARNPIPNVQWEERGPNDVGGRTRALMFDPNDNSGKKAWAGGVGGGIWFTNDITATNANWQRVDDFWSNMAVTAIDYDPVNTNTFYVGTGEGFGNADAISGDGVWKTTNGGNTWQHLSNTTGFGNCNKIVSWKANHVLVATGSGIQLSTNGGANWTQLYSNYAIADAEKSVNGDLYVSTFGGDVWRSYDDGVTWPYSRNGTEGRVEISTSPSDNNVLYATINSGGDVVKILRSSDRGATWVEKTVPRYKEQLGCGYGADIYTRGQGWYDLISLVKSNDPNTIIIGGIDLYRSEDGGTTWETISYWTGTCDAYVHADQHALASRPGFPNEIISGNDGGVFYSSNAFESGSNPTFNHQSENYNVTQFFAVAMHPGLGVHNFLSGAQDNGTVRLTNNGIGGSAYVSGGDGGFCHIDQDNPNIQISSYVRNNYYYTNSNGSFLQHFVDNSGRFINPTDYDNDANILYACAGNNQYLRITGFGGSLTDEFVTAAAFNGQVSCVRTSPNVSNRVYFGIDGNQICRVDNAHSASPTITYLGQPSVGYVSSIDVEVGNENHLLITYSNYGITSVFESVDGGSNWNAVEGDLPNMPIRWGIFAPQNADQAILATELGVWTTDNLNGANTDWDPTNTNLANTRVDMIEFRSSDNLVAAATHGRGLFTSTSFNSSVCVLTSAALGTQTCDPNTSTYSQEITLEIQNSPASGTVSLNGQIFNFTNGQSSTTHTFTLTNLTSDGLAHDLVVSFSASAGCNKTYTDFIQAPFPNCLLNNNVCSGATVIPIPGIYTCNGPDSGSGCNYCDGASMADWFTFTPTTNGTLTVKSCGGGIDTRLIISEGSCGNLVINGLNDDFCEMYAGSSEYASQVIVENATANTTYYIEWDNRWSTSGFDFEVIYESDVPCVVTTTLFVDPEVTSNGIGCSWETAYKYLQDAIDAAEFSGTTTELWLKEGTHKPGKEGEGVTRFITFETEESVSIYGGFNGSETLLSQRDPASNVTILSGDIGIQNNSADNIFNIFTHRTEKHLLIDGIIIEEGEETSGNDWSGAAIWNTGKMTIRNCILRNNHATSVGSAVYNSGSGAEIIVDDVTFEGNTGDDILNTSSATMILSGSQDIKIKE
ncbi:beta propeller repeat protein [Portibacter lacus]|uniref:Uncharacterized protein n=1 Tax=Portibacter lacus TaxID=1099794 RepID=A0AA37SQ80_9BACT|nr:hypothetical protein [Portibacter lacus]GLR17304.1 hypothetical protein GCM10007940_19190 [Portibacter lacus]